MEPIDTTVLYVYEIQNVLPKMVCMKENSGEEHLLLHKTMSLFFFVGYPLCFCSFSYLNNHLSATYTSLYTINTHSIFLSELSLLYISYQAGKFYEQLLLIDGESRP